ncbi:MAG: hypothetical protein LH616_08600 [Ilumatobacteraceae bacterium]|nr:hypothetical protein [Ilumatobacteraceae bacterium]
MEVEQVRIHGAEAFEAVVERLLRKTLGKRNINWRLAGTNQASSELEHDLGDGLS